MAKRLQQSCCNQHGNLVRFKTEKPSRLQCIETSGDNLPTQEFSLLCYRVHTPIRNTH